MKELEENKPWFKDSSPQKKKLPRTCVQAIRMHKYIKKEVPQTFRSQQQHLCIATASMEGGLCMGLHEKANKYKKEVRLERT